MRIFYAIILSLLTMVHVQLFASDSGIQSVLHLRGQLKSLSAEMSVIKAKNAAIIYEIEGLKNDVGSIESKARQDLGFIRKGEIYLRLIHDRDATKDKT